jgi:hypothetical protein
MIVLKNECHRISLQIQARLVFLLLYKDKLMIVSSNLAKQLRGVKEHSPAKKLLMHQKRDCHCPADVPRELKAN